VRSTTRRARPSARPTNRKLARTGLLAGLAVLLGACSGDQSMLDPAGPFAAKPDSLFTLVFWIAVVVFVLVQGLIIYTAVKYRAKDGDDELPVQTHGNTRLEIFWTVVPALILAGIAVPTVQQVFDLAEEPEGAMTVEVVGHRWWWEYRYPDAGVITANELVIPVDTPIRLEMTSEDPAADTGVIHSYWVPALAGKQDVVPGRVVTLNMQADEPGRYLGQCTEYCGLSHANMRNRAVAMEQADFDEWLANQQQAAVEPEEGSLEAQGAELFSNNCAACHQIRSEPVTGESTATSMTGPNLTHLMTRKEFAGAIFDLYLREDPSDPNSPFTDEVNVEQLRAWVQNAPSQKAMRPEQGYSMPSFANLPDEQIDALVAYLTTLE
jgi:cytochrome c oxidase subunit 2